MGQTYSVIYRLKTKDEPALIEKMQEFIKEEEAGGNVNFRIPEYVKKGIGTESLEDLMKIFITESDFSHEMKGKTHIFRSGFDACYGWEGVMLDMFQYITSALENGSNCIIYPDDDYDRMVVRNGECVQTH